VSLGKPIVLTGATGFIGSALRRAFAGRRDIIAIARGGASDDVPGTTWTSGDLSTPSSIAWPEGADTLIYAAQSRRYRDVPAGCGDMVDVNVRGLTALLDAGERSGLRRVVLLSTANVYARCEDLIREEAEIAPASFYAHTKRIAELVLEANASRLDCTILRLFTVYGAGQRDALVPRLIEKVERGEAVRIGPRGGLLLSPIYVDDVCDAIDRALDQPIEPRCRALNVGGADAVTMRQLGSVIGEVVSRPPVFEILPDERASGWASANERARIDLGWAPAVTLRDGLARTAAARRGGAAAATTHL
jgi:nucleoside-diphosphate-sugar epimerase